MTAIIILILLGILLVGVEIFLLPGITFAGIGAFISCGIGVYLTFDRYGTGAGFIALAVVLILSIIVIVIGLRPKTWRKLTLKNNIDSTSQQLPQDENVKIGDRGFTLTRLAPMGKVIINDKTFEAKSIDVYIDQKKPIEVTGFDNFNVIVKLSDNE